MKIHRSFAALGLAAVCALLLPACTNTSVAPEERGDSESNTGQQEHAAVASVLPSEQTLQSTIEQLGTMRSGLANYSALPEFGELLSADATAEPEIAQLVEPAFAASPVFDPGAEYEYSNTNTLLLGEIIEVVEGRSWFDSVQARILDPLVMYEPTDELVVAIVVNGTGEDPGLPAAIFEQIRELL